jgi:hypothetical protein
VQLGAERGAKKALADLGVGKVLALGSAPAADLVMFACCRYRDGGGESDCHDRDDFHGRGSQSFALDHGDSGRPAQRVNGSRLADAV